MIYCGLSSLFSFQTLLGRAIRSGLTAIQVLIEHI